jgi:radical SAM protein with 4Fe4S-binding SPASM domain
MDVVPGVRVDTLGRETEAKVRGNLDQLRERRIPFGAITVLAKHTCPAICRIYDFWAAQGADFRVLPLFAGPEGRATETFEAAEPQLAGALCRLFEHRMKRADRIRLAPLDEWLTVVVRRRMGAGTEMYDRRREGESVIVVRPNGDLFQTNEVGVPSLSWGSLAQNSLEEILADSRYEASLRRSESISATICGDCTYRGACDGYPAHTERFPVQQGVRCPVAFQVFEYMNAWLDRRGIDSGHLLALAQRSPHEAACVAELS